MKFAALASIVCLSLITAVSAEDHVILKLWPKGAPEKPDFKIEPEMAIKKDDGIMRVSNVSDPTITLYKADKPNGAAVLVCPGGGYSILAIEHEGIQVCEWLNTLGVTGVLLKYRVPRRDNDKPYEAPLQDAQRAMGLIRHHASEWGVDPKRVGILGFSAGGNLTVMTSLHPNERTYTEDPTLDMNARPDFMIPVYPAYLANDDKNPTALKSEIAITADAPPMFIAHASDDRITASASAMMYLEYKKLNLPAEIHLYAKGGHGFGMKKNGLPVNDWYVRCGEWMAAMGLLKAAE